MTLCKNKYRIEPARLLGYDYGCNGAYHITICTKDRLPYFGEIVETDYNPSLPKTMNLPLREITNPSFPLTNNLEDTIKNTSLKANQNNASLKTDYNPSLQPTKLGTAASENWLDIPNHFSFVLIDTFIIMPNHIHGILFINKQENDEAVNSNSNNIASIIRSFKGSVKRYANTHNIPFEWQERYHDRIIRDNKELNNTRLYIDSNPANWINDEYKKQSSS